ncbi:MAG: helix-turn-helix domain-containing protein [Sporomusaceae bacterium]|nr:helix-turn-helix domain-containing protein [Sporomusaceae bacterium]
MKVGIVGPPAVVEKITQIIGRDFHQIEATIFPYREYSDVPTLIAGRQEHLNALLFAGATIMSYTEKQIKPTIPWEFIPRSGSALARTLLQIALAGKYDIRRISFDLYSVDQLSEILEEIGFTKDEVKVYTVSKNPFDADYFDYICAFHEQLYRCNKASCCITGFTNVHNWLTAKNIPCFRVDPTASIIRQTLNKMQLNHLIQVSQQSQIVTLCVRTDSPGEYSLLRENEYQYIIDKTNIARQIYLFAQRIQAAVVEVGMREFLLFSTKQLLESVTDNFEKIELLETVEKNTSSTVSIGIGYGQTAQEARQSASLGMERASKLGGNKAFIVYGGNKIVGPIHHTVDERQEKTGEKIDKKFFTISEKSGVSINTIFRLYSILEHQGKTRFTTAELADLAGVTTRTINRILSKLALHGFCTEVGKRVLTKGRPSRIVEIIFP